ncbi:MAG: 30S ribosomal protein S12 methylthiotransferase RimO [Firmicutes bacterium]|nr:30S ribosomal protein S12 methylthiotransferase RimO [Bacillota bacterium]
MCYSLVAITLGGLVLKVGMITLGCAKNTVDTEIMLANLKAHGYEFTDNPEEAHILVINTCGFIQAAKEESIDTILEMAVWKEQGVCRLLIVTGCLSQRYGEEILAEMPEVDAVLGTGQLDKLVHVIEEALDGRRVCAISQPAFDYDNSIGRLRVTPRYSAYLKIAEGCDHRCAYCAIPLIRGNYRSRSQESIVREVENLAREGVLEINIIAQDVTRYGLDRYGRYALPELLRKILQIEGPAWLRLLYAYPTNFTPELIELMANESRLLEYVDLPLQHISPRILKAMRRPDNPEQIRRLLYALREAMPQITLRTTFIVGFPGETEQDVELLAEFMREIQFDHVGVFTYSREEGTAAAAMPDQIPPAISQERRDYLMSIQAPISLARNERYVGQTIEVLVEEDWPDGQGVIGRGRKDAPEVDGLVYVRDSQARPGQIILAEIEQALDYDLVGVARA